jgi:hypothetical protein
VPSLTKERNLIQQLLIWTIERGHVVQGGYDSTLGKLGLRLAGDFPPATPSYLKTKLMSEEAYSMLTDGQFVHLPAIEKDGWMLPILSMRWNFASVPLEFRIRVALFMLNRVNHDTSSQAFAFRLEMSEDNTGSHCYPHAQVIRQWDTAGKRFPIPSPQWLPESFPAWPLDSFGTSPLGLLIAVFVTLYGARFKNLLIGAPFSNQLKPYLQGTRYLQAA